MQKIWMIKCVYEERVRSLDPRRAYILYHVTRGVESVEEEINVWRRGWNVIFEI